MNRAILIVSALIVLFGLSVYARENIQELPFDLSEIIEKVSHHPVQEGNNIIIRSKVYEAFFNEYGIILKLKNRKARAKDLIIPLNGKPEITEGKVVYKTKNGKISFEGNDRGLKFEQIDGSQIITEYSGNIAKICYNSKQVKADGKLFTMGEFLIDINLIYYPKPYDQTNSSVAFDGTNYLVVWQEEYGLDDIYGTRVTQYGQILDPFGIAISAANSRQLNPSVCFGGTNFFVVWHDYRSGYHNFDIYGTRVSRSGTVLDPEGIAISAAANDQKYPSVVSDNTNYLVVWQDERNDTYDIYGARVAQSGAVLDPSGIAISVALRDQEFPCLTFGGNFFLAVWQDKRNSNYFPDIYGARINRSGEVLDSNGIAISTAREDQERPSVVFGGSNYFVVWQDDRGDSSLDIYGARVNQSGAVLDPNGIAISTLGQDQKLSSVAFGQNNYFVVWQDERAGTYDFDIYGARVNQSGAVLDPVGFTISTAQRHQSVPAVIFGEANYFVIWQDERAGTQDFDIYGTRILTNGTVLDTAGIIVSAIADDYAQGSPSVAFDGTNYLVVWSDERSDDLDIYGSRISPAGLILDPLCIPISTEISDQYSPSVVFGETNYFIVWSDERNFPASYIDIYGTRVSQSGLVLDPSGIPVSNGIYDQNSPSIAFDGTNYLVVWEDRRNGFTNSDIYGTRVNQSGVVIEPSGIIISNASRNQEFPSVAFDGTNYLVVWQDERGANRDIYGSRVSQMGTVLEPFGIAISTASSYQESTSVAFAGTNYLVVWQDKRGTSYDIYGARVNQVGNVLDPSGIPISTRSLDQTRPSVAFDGANYFIVWQDYGTGYPWDIYGAKLNFSGTIIDTFAVSTQVGDQLTPALAHGSENQLLIVYTGWTDSIGRHPASTMRIWGKLYPGPGIEEKSSKPNASRLMPEIYPNPAKSVIRVRYPSSTEEIKIYNSTGKLVKTFPFSALNGQRSTVNEIIWYGFDDSGRKLPNGVYLARFQTTQSTETKQIIILR